MPLYHDCRPVTKTIFDNDFRLSDFAEAILKGWGNSIPPDQIIDREQFNAWKDKLNQALDSAAEDYFKRLEAVMHNLNIERKAKT